MIQQYKKKKHREPHVALCMQHEACFSIVGSTIWNTDEAAFSK